MIMYLFICEGLLKMLVQNTFFFLKQITCIYEDCYLIRYILIFGGMSEVHSYCSENFKPMALMGQVFLMYTYKLLEFSGLFHWWHVNYVRLA